MNSNCYRHLLSWTDSCISIIGERGSEIVSANSSTIKKLKDDLESFDARIIEKQNIIQIKRDKIVELKKCLQMKQHSILQDIQFTTKENEQLTEERSDVIKKKDEVAEHTRHLVTMTKPLGVSCKVENGTVLCPEGKVCWSQNEKIILECNYWDCPSISSTKFSLRNSTNQDDSTSSIFTSANSTVLAAKQNEC